MLITNKMSDLMNIVFNCLNNISDVLYNKQLILMQYNYYFSLISILPVITNDIRIDLFSISKLEDLVKMITCNYFYLCF